MEEGESIDLNNAENNQPHINRGVELLLRNKRRRPEQPKTFEVKFGKMVSFFKRELHLYLNFSLDYHKINSSEDE